MIDSTVYNQLKPLDLSQFSNRFIERKRQGDEDARKRQQEAAAAQQQQFQNTLATQRADLDVQQQDMVKQKWDEELETLKQVRTEKRKNFLTQFLGDEAETLSALPEDKRGDYYKRVLRPGLEDSGFNIEDLPEDYQPEMIDGWRMRALPPEKREDLRVSREKLAKENAKKTLFEEWNKSVEPYLRSKNFKLKQEDVNRLMATFPTDLAGYQPAEKFLDNLRLQPQPIPGLTTTPRQQFRDVMDLRKDFEDNLEIKALKIAEQKVNQINTIHRGYLEDLKKGEVRPQFGDNVLAYNFNKMLDEASVVMPGEFDRLKKGAGIEDRIISYVDKVLNGGLDFTPEQRDEIVRVSNALFSITRQRASNTYAQYKNEANIYGLDPYRIVGGVQHILEPGARRPAGAGPNPPKKTGPGKVINEGTTKSGKKYIVEELQ